MNKFNDTSNCMAKTLLSTTGLLEKLPRLFDTVEYIESNKDTESITIKVGLGDFLASFVLWVVDQGKGYAVHQSHKVIHNQNLPNVRDMSIYASFVVSVEHIRCILIKNALGRHKV